jgi:cyclic pyranopterin phosphate synthase
MPKQGVEKLPHDQILTFEEFENVVSVAAELGITKVRLTGGEPLVKKGIEDIIRRINNIPGIEDIGITTNGLLLKEKAQALKDAGVKRINISLDTLNADKYTEITRGGFLEDALSGIETAIEYGFAPIKLNVVLMGGVNDMEIPAFSDFAESKGINLRFIEIMPIGECAGWNSDRFVKVDKVLDSMPGLLKESMDGVSTVYRVPGHKTTIGLISPISSHFCSDCNKIRVTSDGRLKPCLHTSSELLLKGLSRDAMKAVMEQGIYEKPAGHQLDTDKVSRSQRNMNAIGG